MGASKWYMMLSAKEQREVDKRSKENREMNKYEYKYITATTDKEKPFYPGLMRNADR